ncbi:SLBB domain-containing protein [Bacteroides sp. ET336]|uniref:polysaccharide biosynthesis/export family protein n=1 Tax=Bacteroides sp. ET336 TaxID=2972459 RepID=UPI0021ABBA9C|nr:SLBB domain-containing protein [Bacteroides sp. ET336]MCR8894177.1 SLBB domain-containing protein [Bacteroides sp. ET336]MDN0058674.1 SLBB domain-containing protein [Bacteroides caecigallinarum]
MRKHFVYAAFSILMMGALPVFAQSGMTDSQVIQYVQDGMKQGKNQQQLMMELTAKGMTQEQALRLKKMYESGQISNSSGISDRISANSRMRQGKLNGDEQSNIKGYNKIQLGMLNDSTMYNPDMFIAVDEYGRPIKPVKPEDQVFGRNIFTNKNLSFEPDMNVATPQDYRLGPGDEIIIDIWGASENSIRQEISPDGCITIPGLGMISLNGLNIADAREYLKSELSKIYADEGNQIQVTLGNTRSIKVNVMGEVMVPGTYTLSAFASVFHALYSAGGITDLGSLRDIRVSRNGNTVANVDVYEYILQGKTDGNISLQEGDVIIVPTYEAIVKVEGKVKRPMKYEMKSDESISTLLKYAGFFAANAYKNSVRVVRQEGRQFSVATVDRDKFASFKVMDGDVVTADSIINRFSNKLEVVGAVYRPGIYEFCENINTVKELLTQADGLLGDAFTNRAVLYRQRENLTSEVLSVDVKGIMNGTAPDVELKNNDLLYIPSIHDIKYAGDVYISGEIKKPGIYPYSDNMTLEDFVITAGGLKDEASLVRVDVSRRIKDNKGTEVTETVGQNFTFGLKDGFIVDGEPGFVLEPYDQVFVRKSPGYNVQKNVKVNGEVLYEGEYSLNFKNERLSSLIERAGGITAFGYAKGAKLTRVANDDEKKRMEDVLKLMRRELGEGLTDSLKLELDSVFTVGIDLEKALAKPGSSADIVLREGDVISVPEMTSTVKINGAVMMPNTVTYMDGENVKYYLNQAGGYSQSAKKSKKFIIYMNGQVERVKARSKKVEPGCEIVVPNKVKKNRFGDIMGYTTSLASLAMMVASIANLVK